MVVLGLDIGTTATKGVAYDGQGQPLASASWSYPIISDRPNHLELRSSDVAEAVEHVIRAIAQAVGPGRIQAIAGTAMGEAVAPVDSGGQILDNTIVALDARAQAQMNRFAETFDPARFFAITGQLPHPIVSLAKILWWRDERPDTYAKAAAFNCWNELLCRQLGVEPAITPSLAARTGMFDLRSYSWSTEILAAAEIDPALLPSIVPAGQVVGEVPAGIAAELGLAKACRVVSGGWDQACAALGAGALEPGTIVNSMGSTDSLNAVLGAVHTTPEMHAQGLTCTPHAIEGLFCTVAFSLTGGNVLQWHRDTLNALAAMRAAETGKDYFAALAEQARSSRRPVWVLPHFVGSGTPHMDPCSMGAVLGLSLSTTPADIARGLIEGVAIEMSQNLDNMQAAGLPVTTLLAGSGGARNATLLQWRSNVFGRPITPLVGEELGCLACGILAWSAVDSTRPPRDLARDWVRFGETVQPDIEAAAYYRERLAAHRELYPALRRLNAAIHACPSAPAT